MHENCGLGRVEFDLDHALGLFDFEDLSERLIPLRDHLHADLAWGSGGTLATPSWLVFNW